MRVAVVASYRRYRSSHWLYDNPQRFEDQNILNVSNANILYTGSGAHHRLGLTAEVVGRNRLS